MLALRNIWFIIVKLEEYKNLPILMFYVFLLIAIGLRSVYLVLYWTPSPLVPNMDWVQQAAKLCVGITQDWITLELAIRIHYSTGRLDIFQATENKLRSIRLFLFANITIIFCAFSIFEILSAHEYGSNGYAFAKNGR